MHASVQRYGRHGHCIVVWHLQGTIPLADVPIERKAHPRPRYLLDPGRERDDVTRLVGACKAALIDVNSHVSVPAAILQWEKGATRAIKQAQ